MAPFRKLRTQIGLRKPYLGKHVHIGRHTYGVTEETITEAKAETPVYFGQFCSVSTGVLVIADMLHSPDRVSTFPLAARLGNAERDPPVRQRPILIGNDVWIERRVILLPGVTIGHGAVIVAGAVVGEDVPPYAIVEGAPARLVRYRFDADTVTKLLAISWWDWPDEKIKAELPSFYGPVEDFIARHAG
jgi:acetyltransferase-like isoleucine patch superfamily enzyme